MEPWTWPGSGAAIADLGAERWNEVYAAAKYASSGGGHAAARLFADAMTGAVDGAELMGRITGKRNQGAVRALGLLPLPDDSSAREAAVTERYRAIQEFLRTSRQFGAQRRASEELAARIGLDNLARTAGYPDPIRLQWAMEAQLAADLRDGSLVVEEDGVQVTLSLNALSAEPEIVVSKNGSLLKTLPARVKKSEAIAALYTRKREIERQVSRMRRSLEDAMCRGDRFTAAEIAGLLQHPVLSRLLRNLVFIQDNTADGQPDLVLGYPVPGSMPAASGGHSPRLHLGPRLACPGAGRHSQSKQQTAGAPLPLRMQIRQVLADSRRWGYAMPSIMAAPAPMASNSGKSLPARPTPARSGEADPGEDGQRLRRDDAGPRAGSRSRVLDNCQRSTKGTPPVASTLS